MHSPLLFGLMWSAIVLAGATLLPPPLLGPLAPVLAGAKAQARLHLNAPAVGFLVATAILAGFGMILQSWLTKRLHVEVPLGTVRWALMTPELGLWLPLVSYSTAAVGGLIAFIRSRGAAMRVPPSAALAAVAFALWYAW